MTWFLSCPLKGFIIQTFETICLWFLCVYLSGYSNCMSICLSMVTRRLLTIQLRNTLRCVKCSCWIWVILLSLLYVWLSICPNVFFQSSEINMPFSCSLVQLSKLASKEASECNEPTNSFFYCIQGLFEYMICFHIGPAAMSLNQVINGEISVWRQINRIKWKYEIVNTAIVFYTFRVVL